MAEFDAMKDALKTLLLPPIGVLLLAGIGLLVAFWRPRVGRPIASAAIALLLLLSIPATPAALLNMLHPPQPFRADSARDASAVVILGGGARRLAPEYGGDTLGRLTLERVRYGARIARLTALPVLVSGGAPQGGIAEAVLMARALEDEFAVQVRWIEDQSSNTHSNAVLTTRLLRRQGIRKVVLVTHAFDMLRASAEFNSLGVQTVPAATNLPRAGETSLMDWLPSVGALQATHYVCYEIAANIVRSLRSDRS